jgi:hypothetical protein
MTSTGIFFNYYTRGTNVIATATDTFAVQLAVNPPDAPRILTGLELVCGFAIVGANTDVGTATDLTQVADPFAVPSQRGMAFCVDEAIDAPGGVGTQVGDLLQEFDGANLKTPQPGTDWRLRAQLGSVTAIPSSVGTFSCAVVQVTSPETSPNSADWNSGVGVEFYSPSDAVMGMHADCVETDVGGFKRTLSWTWRLNDIGADELLFYPGDSLWLIYNCDIVGAGTIHNCSIRGLVTA